jgi:hypothetical protein
MGARWLAVVLVVVGLGVAHADDKPWAKGVSAEHQAAALAIYKDGNTFFEASEYKKALDRYTEALKLWDHPAIRYNMAVCLINLTRPVEAYESLIAALAYGDAPLGPDVFKEGQNYKKLLEGQLAELEVRVDEPGAEVTLDGQPLLRGPGTATRRVLAGKHQVVATKRGFDTETSDREYPAAHTTTVELAMKRSATTKLRWTPWVFVFSGAVVAAVGGGVYLKARGDLADYDNGVKMSCAMGCPESQLPPELQGLDVHARHEQTAAIVIAGVGGAAIATGVILLQLRAKGPVVAPAVGADRAALVVSGAW